MSGSGQPGHRARPLRPYVITRGRARASRNTVGVETLLIAPDPTRELPVTATREERALVRMCSRLLSLAEAAAHLMMLRDGAMVAGYLDDPAQARATLGRGLDALLAEAG